MNGLNFNDIPMDTKIGILSHLDFLELGCMALVNKIFSELAKMPTLYAPEYLLIKEQFLAYKIIDLKVEEHEKTLALMDYKLEGLVKESESFFGYFCTTDEDIEEMKELKIEVDELKSNIGLLENKSRALSDQYRSKKAEHIYAKNKILQKQLRRQVRLEMMKRVFGGEIGYEAIPVLDHKKFKDLKSISVNILTAPIMCGIYKTTLFFTLRYKIESSGIIHCRVFDETSWKRGSDLNGDRFFSSELERQIKEGRWGWANNYILI